MNSKLKEYIILGINHHMLNKWIADNPKDHHKTLLPLLEDERFEAIDLFVTHDKKYQKEEIEKIRSCNKKIIYNVGARGGFKIPNPSSLIKSEQTYALDFFKNEIDRAIAIDCEKIVIFSGEDTMNERDDAKKVFMEFSMKLCEYVPKNIKIMIEPADRDIDKKMLIGPTKECKDLVDKIKFYGYDNIAMMVDMCHLPLLNESIEDALEYSKDHLEHIHIGNSIKCDSSSKWYGDKHPPYGIENSVYDIKDIRVLIKKANELKYIDENKRNTMTFEMVGYSDLTWQESVDKFYEYWSRV